MNPYKSYRHQIPIQIRFSDIDRLNHVNNACYHNYFELGRVKYFGVVLKGEVNWDESGFILARTEIDHIAPLLLEDENVICYTRVSRLGNKSMTVENSIIALRQGNPVVCAECKGVLVAMDYRENQSMLLPGLWKKRFREYEGSDL
jgi:acyl-CoA thioester hydrolase